MLLAWTCFPTLADLLGSKGLGQELSTFSRHWLAMALAKSLPQLPLTSSAGILLHMSCLKFSSLLLGLPLSFFPAQRNRQLVLNYTIENLIVDIPFSLSSSRKAVNLCFLLSRGMLLYKLLVLTSGTQSCLKMLGITLVG